MNINARPLWSVIAFAIASANCASALARSDDSRNGTSSPDVLASPSPQASATSSLAATILALRAGESAGAGNTSFADLLAPLIARTRGGDVHAFSEGSRVRLCFRPRYSSPTPGIPQPRPACDAGAPGWILFVPTGGMPRNMLSGLPPTANFYSLTTRLGMTFAMALAAARRDERFAGKTITRAKDGTLLQLATTFQDPPPARYDHGMYVRTYEYDIFRNGRVVAIALTFEEN